MNKVKEEVMIDAYPNNGDYDEGSGKLALTWQKFHCNCVLCGAEHSFKFNGNPDTLIFQLHNENAIPELKTDSELVVDGIKYKIIKSGKLDTRSFEPLMELKMVR